jgi:hypothetical protein
VNSTPSRQRGSAFVPLAVGLVALVVAGIVLWSVLTRVEAPPVAQPAPVEEPLQPSRRVAIPEVREPVRDPDADALALWERAGELAKADGPREDVLRAYAEAEDALHARLDELYRRRDSGDVLFRIEAALQECIEASDAIATALFDDARVERTPWRDLIADPNAEHAHDGLLRYERSDGEIRAVGSPPGTKLEGVFSIGDRERWRDFVVEVEYAPVRGESRLYFRLGRMVQTAPDEIEAEAVGDGVTLERDAPRTLTATYIGSRRRFEWSANTGLATTELNPINWRRSRVGAFGAVVRGGAELRITRLRARILRAGP